MYAMNEGASMTEWLPRIRVPPNQRTIAIIMDPRSSLTGCALDWRIATLLSLERMDSVTFSNLEVIFFSARNALMMRSPPRVSSTWLIVSLQYFWASADWALSWRPIALMIQIMTGAKIITNRVSSQDILKRTIR